MSPNFNSLKIKFWTKTVNKEYPVWSKDTLLLHNIYKSFKLNFAVGVMTHQQACVSSVPQRVNSLLMLPRAKSFVFLYFLVLESTANQKTSHILNISVLGKRRNWFSPIRKLLQVQLYKSLVVSSSPISFSIHLRFFPVGLLPQVEMFSSLQTMFTKAFSPKLWESNLTETLIVLHPLSQALKHWISIKLQ